MPPRPSDAPSDPTSEAASDGAGRTREDCSATLRSAALRSAAIISSGDACGDVSGDVSRDASSEDDDVSSEAVAECSACSGVAGGLDRAEARGVGARGGGATDGGTIRFRRLARRCSSKQPKKRPAKKSNRATTTDDSYEGGKAGGGSGGAGDGGSDGLGTHHPVGSRRCCSLHRDQTRRELLINGCDIVCRGSNTRRQTAPSSYEGPHTRRREAEGRAVDEATSISSTGIHLMKKACQLRVPKRNPSNTDRVAPGRSASSDMSFFFRLALVAPATVLACSNVRIDTTDGLIMVGRAMELGLPKGSQPNVAFPGYRIYVNPRNQLAPGHTLCGALHPYTLDLLSPKYGYLGVQSVLPLSIFDSKKVENSSLLTSTSLVSDGQNEAGLSVSTQTFATAIFEESRNWQFCATRASPSAKLSIPFFDVPRMILGRCDSAECARELMRNLIVFNPVQAAMDRSPALKVLQPHWSVVDRSGDAVVIQYIGGKLTLSDNRHIGVFTNDPPYPWMLGYLNQFAGVPSHVVTSSPYSVPSDAPEGGYPSSSVGANVPEVVSHGTATALLPGSFTPPDRFVKLFMLKEMVRRNSPIFGEEGGVSAVTGLLNSVTIVRGTVVKKSPLEAAEETIWSVIKSPNANTQGGAFYYRSYNQQGWKRIDLSKIDWAKKYAPISFEPKGSSGFSEVTFSAA